jgi:PAS domain S-box-containing protein
MEHDDLSSHQSFLAGSGEMRERTCVFDWSRTPVGPAAKWPHSLTTAVRIMLDSRYPMWLGWGPDFTFFYNDAYARMTLGPKHPWALGRSAREVWSEIWDDIGPRAESVLRNGQATWDEGLLLFLERRGFPEETYHTFSYSPVPDDQGDIGGMLCVVTEDTERTIAERRLRTLRELAARTTEESKSAEDACQTAARTLAGNPHDLPFVLIYLLDDQAQVSKLVGATGLSQDSPAAPRAIDLGVPAASGAGWPLLSAWESGRAEVVADLERRFGPLRCVPWPETIQQAVVVPMAKPGQARPAGFVVAGVSPRLVFDDRYTGFLDLLAGHVATAIANARSYEEERRRAEVLAELDRAKTAFFSNASHEFRTPLTLMLGPVEDLLVRSYTELSPAAKGQLEVVHRNGLRLLRLVNTLLDFSRIEAGRVRAVYLPTDLSTFTGELASVFRAAIERAGLRMVVDCPPLEEPAFVDREMWEKLVLNLLSNAFKFTFEGEIEVSLHRRGDRVELKVRDTGTGIPAEELPRVFDRFHRIENTRSRTHEGTGIGLALVQELVKLHGGTISVASKLERGTTFTVSIPLGSSHLPADQMGGSRPLASTATGAGPFVEESLRWLPDESLQGDDSPAPIISYNESFPTPYRPSAAENDDRPRVLIADDNADMRQYLVRLLTEHYQVEAVADGEAALASVWERVPDLILTDVMMPRLDGFGLLHELRADPSTRALPVIMLSARAGEESRVEGMEAGVDDYLVKPFSARELSARVSACLQMARLRQEVAEAVEQERDWLRVTLASIGDAVITTDTEGRVSFLNRVAEELTVWTNDEAAGQDLHTVFRIINEQTRQPVENPATRALRDGTIVGLANHTILVSKDGTEHPIDDSAAPVNDGQGHIAGCVLVFRDITARRRAEKALRESEALFRSMADNAPTMLRVTDPSAACTYLSKQWYDFTGQTPAQSLGFGWLENVHCEDRQPAQDVILEANKRRAPVSVDYRLRRRDGAYRWVLDASLPRFDETGRFQGYVGTITDVHERKLAEEATQTRSDQLRRLAEVATRLSAAPDVDSLTRVVTAEARTLIGSHQAVLGFTIDQSWAQSINAISLSEKYAAYRNYVERPDGSGIYSLVCRTNTPMRLTHDELEAHAQYKRLGREAAKHLPLRGWLAAPLVSRDGRNLGLIQLSDKYEGDFTEDDEAVLVQLAQITSVALENARLVQSLREADSRKDEFLATLVHELRNPMAPIRNGLQVMKLARGDLETIEDAQAVVERQVTQLVRLVDDLMDVSRITRGKIELRKTRIDLAKVVQHAIETSRPLIEGSGQEFTLVIRSAPILVDADATRLAQVFSNLLNNAAKYTEPGGQVLMRVEREDQEAVVRVRDTGAGIPAHMLTQVFEMFKQVDQSLERSQGGLGVGLTLVKRLVEMHGGTVEARSAGQGSGSEFVVRLPMVTSPAGEQDRADDSTAAAPPGRRILVVDDNRDSALSLATMLKIMGNETQTAYDGLEALQIAESFRPQVVLLDIGMPRLNGYDVASRIRLAPGNQEVILVAVTGWGQDEDRRRSKEAGFDFHIVKPVEPAVLERLLTELNARRG